jgi:hypothetical protein
MFNPTELTLPSWNVRRQEALTYPTSEARDSTTTHACNLLPILGK